MKRSLKEVFENDEMDIEDWAVDIFTASLFARDSDQVTFDKLNELFNDETKMSQSQFKKLIQRAAQRQLEDIAGMLKATIDSLGLEEN